MALIGFIAIGLIVHYAVLHARDTFTDRNITAGDILITIHRALISQLYCSVCETLGRIMKRRFIWFL